MKKQKNSGVAPVIAPRLPENARERLKKGGAHKNPKAYRRREKHQHRGSE